MSTRTESVTVPDGRFDLPVWLPESGRGPGLLLIQEIFGVGPYIRQVGEDLAALGYVVAAPDLFWRLRPGWAAAHDDEGLQESMALANRFDAQAGVADLQAALDHLAGLQEVSGGTGALGFCFGGTMGFLLAARAKLSALVSYYGSGVPDSLGLLGDISCPVQFHFGGSDPFIPREKITAVEEAVAGLSNVEIYVEEEGGHAFHNHESDTFYQPEPAARAWRLTEEFLARHLPV